MDNYRAIVLAVLIAALMPSPILAQDSQFPKQLTVTSHDACGGVTFDTKYADEMKSPATQSAWKAWHLSLGREIASIFDRRYMPKLSGMGELTTQISYSIKDDEIVNFKFVNETTYGQFDIDVLKSLKSLNKSSFLKFPEKIQGNALEQTLTFTRYTGSTRKKEANAPFAPINMPICGVITDFPKSGNK